ncbi:hypothetical protein HHI36_000762 [Cryptolaemus montrouzieri]|uniref:Uncharacterized protein n=1 Tax=Cryptolaemus montrouzieri TaxID=559131 RepID=A0ABD2P5M2_9CUCU
MTLFSEDSGEQKNYEQSIVELRDKRFYSYINKALSSRSSQLFLKDDTQEVIKDSSKIAELLSWHFESVFTPEDMNNFRTLPSTTRSVNEINDIVKSEETKMQAIQTFRGFRVWPR